ncbi:WHG domain-containing protein [Saccharopolyspora sp. NPDC002376]
MGPGQCSVGRRQHTAQDLRAGLPDGLDDAAAARAALAAWSLAHGFATLTLARTLPPAVLERDAAEAFREIADLLSVRESGA